MLICYNIRDKFTSHYVSINSCNLVSSPFSYTKFTSHYVSINSKAGTEKETSTTKFTSHYVSINSVAFNPSGVLISAFTSHYVSINSYHRSQQIVTLQYLHPTMYLLILDRNFVVYGLSLNTYHSRSIK